MDRGLLVLAAGTAQAEAQPAPTYRTTKTISIGAPDRWDYLTFDQNTGRLYVSHGDRVDVLDGNTGAILGRVEGMPGGSHGIGIINAVGKGYTDDGKAGEAVSFDLKTFKVNSRIKAKDDADGITVDPKTGHVSVVDGDSAVLTVIDPKTDKVVATVKGGGGLEFAVPDDEGTCLCQWRRQKRNGPHQIAPPTRPTPTGPFQNVKAPTAWRSTSQSRRLFVSCVNKILTVVNADTGAVGGELADRGGTDGVAFDPKRKLVFSANGIDGTVSIIRENSPDSYVPAGEIKTGVTGRTLTINPATGRLFVAVAAIDPSAPVPPGPNGRPGRAKPLPGSLKVVFLDPQ